MRKSTKLFGALAVAGLVAAGGSAYTASNTWDVLAEAGVSGYGQTIATGATITSLTNNLVTTDNSKLASVEFVSTTDLTGKTVSMTLRTDSAGTNTVVGVPYTCTFTPFTASSTTITCATADNPLLSAYDTTGLTVI